MKQGSRHARVLYKSRVQRILEAFVPVVVAASSAACQKPITGIHVRGKVMNQDGELIDGANLWVDGELAGTSNPQGEIDVRLTTSPEKQHNLKATKESVSRYYSTWTETIQTTRAMRYNVAVRIVLNDAPKMGTVDAPPPASPITLSTNSDHSGKEPEGKAQMRPIASASQKGTTVAGHSNGPTVHWRSSAQPLSPRTLESIPRGSIYIRHLGKPVSDALVFADDIANQKIDLICRTNANGRCRVPLSGNQSQKPLKLIVKKAGFKSQRVEPFQSSKLAYVDLETGETIELFATTCSALTCRGVPSVRFSSATHEAITDLDGLAILAINRDKADAEVHVHADDLVPRERTLSLVERDRPQQLQFLDPSYRLGVSWEVGEVSPFLWQGNKDLAIARLERVLSTALTGLTENDKSLVLQGRFDSKLMESRNSTPVDQIVMALVVPDRESFELHIRKANGEPFVRITGASADVLDDLDLATAVSDTLKLASAELANPIPDALKISLMDELKPPSSSIAR